MIQDPIPASPFRSINIFLSFAFRECSLRSVSGICQLVKPIMKFKVTLSCENFLEQTTIALGGRHHDNQIAALRSQ